MSIESQIFAALKGLVANRVYPDLAPDAAVRPYIVYQQVGGKAVNFISQAAPSKRNARVQVAVWGDTRASVSLVAGQVEDALRADSGLQTTVLGAAVSDYEADTKLRGSRQDFSVWC